MAYYCDIEYEEAVLDDAIFVTYGVTVEEQALLSTLATEMASTLSFETAVLDDLAVEQVVNLTTETASITGLALSGLTILEVLVEDAVLGSSSTLTGVSNVFETAVLDDSTYQVFTNVAVETAQISNSIPDLPKKLNIAYEAAYVSGVAGSVYVDVIEDYAVALGVTTPPALTVVSVEAAVLGSTSPSTAILTSLGDEAALLGDVLFGYLTASNTVTDAFWASGFAVSDDANIGYAAHGVQWAMSRYDDLAARQIVKVGAKYLSLAEEGVYEFTTTAPVDAYVLTGKNDFGKAQYKRVPYVYVSGEAFGTMKLTSYVDSAGDDAEYEYDFDLRNNIATRNNRVTLGKGARSRYWQFKIANDGGDMFSVRSADADVALSNRRV